MKPLTLAKLGTSGTTQQVTLRTRRLSRDMSEGKKSDTQLTDGKNARQIEQQV